MIDSKKLMEDIRKIDDMRLCFIVEKAIKSQTAPLTKEQFLAECKGLGGIEQNNGDFYFQDLKIYVEICETWCDIQLEIPFESHSIKEGIAFRQALTVLQAHLQAEGIL